MVCTQVENNTGMLLYYNFPVIQKPAFEPQKPVIYATYAYTQNTVIYRATATKEGVYRYTYVVNNPLVYTDPSGDIIPAIMIGFFIGAVIEGWVNQGTPGQIIGGAIIGGVAGGVGAWAGGAGALWGGAISGAISGGGFAALHGGNIAQGALYGAISGAAGGIVGGAIGGGAGAFAGGATAGAVGTALYGGSDEDIAKSALLGGVVSFASYHALSYPNWRSNVRNQDFYGRSIKYGQYLKMQASYTRGKFWGSEKAGGGFWLTDKGISKQGVSYDAKRGNAVRFDYAQKPKGAWATFHPHPYNESQVVGGNLWHSPQDLSNVQTTRFSSMIINKHGAELITPISTHYINFWPYGMPYYNYYYPW